MPKSKVLIVFHSEEGQSEKIAASIGTTLQSCGIEVGLSEVSDAPPLASYDGVVLGDSIHAVKHSAELRAYLKQHANALNDLPTGLFQVSLTSANPDDAHTMAARELIDRLLADTGYTPTLVAMFAGRLAYSQYGRIKRHIMKWIVRREGGGTDTSRDYEYTDWNAVTAFAKQIASLVTERSTAVAR